MKLIQLIWYDPYLNIHPMRIRCLFIQFSYDKLLSIEIATPVL